MKVKSEMEVAQSCPTLSDPMDYGPPGSSIHGIFQARVLEWGAIAFSNLGMGEGKSKAEPILSLTPTNHQWARAFVDGGMGLRAETAVSSYSHVVV